MKGCLVRCVDDAVELAFRTPGSESERLSPVRVRSCPTVASSDPQTPATVRVFHFNHPKVITRNCNASDEISTDAAYSCTSSTLCCAGRSSLSLSGWCRLPSLSQRSCSSQSPFAFKGPSSSSVATFLYFVLVPASACLLMHRCRSRQRDALDRVPRHDAGLSAITLLLTSASIGIRSMQSSLETR